MAVGAVVLIFAGGPNVAMAAFVVAGIGMTLSLNGITVLIYSRVPNEFRGRIMSLWLVGFVGSRPLAAALNGFLTDVASLAVALAVTAALVFAAAYVCRSAAIAGP